MAAKRVSLPSTISSKTMSARFRPCWVRWAHPTLSIFTANAGRSGATWPYANGAPVSGIRSTGAGTVVGAAVVVEASVVVVASAVVFGTVVVGFGFGFVVAGALA